MSNRYAIILAAGKGTRMKSKLYKVLHQVCGKPMIRHVVDEAGRADFSKIYVIVGHGANDVKAAVGKDAECLLQKEQLGTGHAVLQAADQLADLDGTTVVLYGDTPLITHQTIEKLIHIQEEQHAAAAVLTATIEDPTGYGRVIRDASGNVAKIVEDKDANSDEKRVKEINTGIYCFNNRKLFTLLRQVTNNNAQGEYYLPDVIGLLVQGSEKVIAYETESFEETLGVNDRIQLAAAGKYMQEHINQTMMKNGVTLVDPASTYLSAECTIGNDTVIYPGTIISGQSRIGSGCTVGPHSQIKNCVIGDETQIEQSVLEDSWIGNRVQIGPFAHIRPLSKIHDQAKVGNFVEVKNTEIGERSKASHLTYLGDATLGKDVNMGCGTITVNYDGKDKFATKIGDGAFIGCNANLVAPVTIGEGAFVAAGSTITQSVNNNALAIARSRQTNKENYALKLNYRANH
ncbi:bifunctional UDP-N-acetylglucosamine diphosphorylase/glucosamine-1-phosphate N-acetyltransferase GlmU [Sporolactobacillus laevolacticus]|uniref:bifunctional UDP-N-acetylglucosamine diphosphorylase/glucosamine-1-phosphate N-acetyltransferase GlmU n=1 Tax=Sporolactobacillus laevolacticus TaxID=33018 RepID=UPI0025B282E1|nr:bifunctional UDP-N-acetylglucosamine diphosphorylase/glucosamine-1-phosphate N-acetyltransferase GlmU [Sporolactobacillus laevolacticus]MDN3956907.1 bifunctional UDP-N-acetylglucosamine diphosphorylase/glucosamine-1-phosphate N-acetyltransferase GlmU [Sporolactobacillus laevolacticus]